MTSRTEHDVIVIGGGVNGAGIARDAATRGMRVLLVEKSDLAKGASGANTGMIHGGIRYLRYDVKTTKISCLDSGYIQQIAPHLLFRIPFIFPILRTDPWGALLLEGAEVFFEAYDVYQPLKRGKSHTRLTAKDVIALEPGITDEVIGAVTMDEWGIDPFRLTVLNALDAVRHGAVVRTYCEVTGFVRDRSGAIAGITFKDGLTSASETHHAPVVVNTTGAWGPKLAKLAGVDYKLRPGKGVHIVYPHRISSYGIVLLAVDGRQLFLMPHENGAIAGTTDDDFYGDLDRPTATEDEVEYIKQSVRRVFPSIDRYRASRTYVGVRPTVWSFAQNEDNLSREHEFYDHAPQGAAGLISVAGGKLAAYRLLAEEVTDIVARRTGHGAACRTHTSPLPGAEKPIVLDEAIREVKISRLAAARMAYRHGARALSILDDVRALPRHGAITCACEPVAEGEVRFAIREELVRRLVDVRRRTRLSMGACGGTHCLARASQLLAQEQGLTAAQALVELDDAMTARFIGQRPVLDGANRKTFELSQAMHYLTANLAPLVAAARLSVERGGQARPADAAHASAPVAAMEEIVPPRVLVAAESIDDAEPRALLPEPR
jgi:glycerol-3-phosphate dehydrogenase